MEHNKVQKEKTLQCWNKVGLFLCTNGSAKVSINGQNFGLTRGMLFVISPLVQVRDMVPAADFESVFFVDDLKVFYPIFKSISDKLHFILHINIITHNRLEIIFQ